MVKAGSGGYSPLQNKSYKRDLRQARDTGRTVDEVRSSSSSSYGGGGRDTSPMAERGVDNDDDIKKAAGTVDPTPGLDDRLREVNDTQSRNIDTPGPALRSAYNKGAISGLVEGYQAIERKAGSYIPSLSDIAQQGREFRQKHPELGKQIYQTSEKIADVTRQVVPDEYGKAIGEKSVGYYKDFETKPISTIGEDVLLYGVGAGVGAGTKVATVGAKSGLGRAAGKLGSSSIAGRALTGSSKALDPLIATAGVGSIGYEIAKATPEERVGMADDIFIGAAGAARGWKYGDKLVGRLQTRGRDYVPLEKITDPAVAKGTQDFPLTRQGQTSSKLQAEFQNNPYGIPGENVPGKIGTWHASKSKYPTGELVLDSTARPKDVPGLYISPRASPAFTRISRGELSLAEYIGATKKGFGKSFGQFKSAGEMFSKGKVRQSATRTKKGASTLYETIFGQPEPVKPSISRMYIDDVVRLPKDKRGLFEAKEFLGSSKSQKGKGYITPDAEARAATGQVESEAVISPGTRLIELQSRYYTKVGGRRIPIDRFISESKSKVPGTKGKTTKGFKDIIEAEQQAYSLARSKTGIVKPGYSTSGVSTRLPGYRDVFGKVEKSIDTPPSSIGKSSLRKPTSSKIPDFDSSPKYPGKSSKTGRSSGKPSSAKPSKQPSPFSETSPYPSGNPFESTSKTTSSMFEPVPSGRPSRVSSDPFGEKSGTYGSSIFGPKTTKPLKDKKRKKRTRIKPFKDSIVDPIKVSTDVKTFDEIVGGKK